MSIGSSGDTAFNSAPLGLVVLACCGHRSLPRRCLLCCSTVWYRVIYTLVYVFLGRNCVTHQSLFLVSPPPPCPCLIRHHGFANSFFLLDCPQTLQRRPGRQFEIFGFEKATSFLFFITQTVYYCTPTSQPRVLLLYAYEGVLPPTADGSSNWYR